MTGEQVPTWCLEVGDVIRVRHQHDSRCGQCLTSWQADAVVTDKPAPVCGMVAVKWAGDARLAGSGAAITGVSVFRMDEPALRIGRLAVRPAACPRAAPWHSPPRNPRLTPPRPAPELHPRQWQSGACQGDDRAGS